MISLIRIRRIKSIVEEQRDKDGILTGCYRHNYLQFRIFGIWFTCAYKYLNIRDGEWRNGIKEWQSSLNIMSVNTTYK